MIQELRIKNFLSFKDEVVFSFEATADKNLEDYYIYEPIAGVRLLKLALVYGANASGKSNLINAFGFIRDFVFRITQSKEVELDFHPFAFNSEINNIGEFELVFYVGAVKHVYKLEIGKQYVKSECLYYYPGTQPAIVFERHFDEKSNTSVIEFGTKLKISKIAKEEISLKTLRNSSVFAAYSQVNISNPALENVYEWFGRQFLTPINPYTSLTDYSDKHIKIDSEIKKQALKFIKKADFNITDISFKDTFRELPEHLLKEIETTPMAEEEKEVIRKEKGFHYDETVFEHSIVREGVYEKYVLPENRQSKGTIRYYGLSAPFYNTIKQNAFLPIDEIGSSLHPLLVKHFIKEFLLQSSSSQLLITTHNMSLLNEKDILRKDAIWFTDKQENGATDLYSAADFSDFRKELSYFNYYKSGKFGAVPSID